MWVISCFIKDMLRIFLRLRFGEETIKNWFSKWSFFYSKQYSLFVYDTKRLWELKSVLPHTVSLALQFIYRVWINTNKRIYRRLFLPDFIRKIKKKSAFTKDILSLIHSNYFLLLSNRCNLFVPAFPPNCKKGLSITPFTFKLWT